jgi:hypothetical protein
MNIKTESRNDVGVELKPEALEVLVALKNLDEQQRLAVAHSELSNLASTTEPKDKLILAAGLVEQALQNVTPGGLTQLTEMLNGLVKSIINPHDSRTEQLKTRLRGVIESFEKLSEPRSKWCSDDPVIKDSLILESKSFDVLLVKFRERPTKIELMTALRCIGYRAATREENIHYANGLIARYKTQRIDEARSAISRHQEVLNHYIESGNTGIKINIDGSQWLTNYQEAAFNMYCRERSAGVDDVNGSVRINHTVPTYELSYFEIIGKDVNPLTDNPFNAAEYDDQFNMLFVKESQKQDE